MFEKLYWLILCTFNVSQDRTCVLNTRLDFYEPLPIILRNGQLLEPDDGNGNVVLNNGDILTLSCEGSESGSIQHPSASRILETATISCENGISFKNEEWLQGLASFSSFRCAFPPIHSSQRTNRTCFSYNQVVEVGYRVQGQFYPLFETCFDHGNLNPIYSKYTQKSYNALYQTRVQRPYFSDDGNYGSLPLISIFSPKGLRLAVARLVGDLIDTYVNPNQQLSRGHLAAKTDFVYAFGERATFHYINCAPQWTGFNGGNWNTLEVDLRDHIHSAGYDTIIYTGTFGVTQLLDSSHRRVDLYLYSDYNNNPVIPVPQYYYKVVYEPRTKRGIAFVGINNPYYNASEARELFFCKDICRGDRNYRWLSWHPDNPAEGYTFCCTISDFRNTIPHLPNFEVQDVLR